MLRSKVLIFCICLFVIALSMPHSAFAKVKNDITVTVSVSPESSFQTTMSFRDQKQFTKRLLGSTTEVASYNPHWIRATLTVKKRTYVYDHDGQLYEKEMPRRYVLANDVRQRIEEMAKSVEAVHFAHAIPWEQVKKTLKRMEFGTVIDLETGQRFDVQRRAGSRHADVQPLTRKDTQIMKNIYQGKWSWKRRAILVEVDGTYFAASMHGMPHGAGAIKGNEFPGHFCIHFFGSSTHRRTEPDPSHSMMILKASGALATTIKGASPEELVGYFLTALHEHDTHAMRMTTDGFSLPEGLSAIESVRTSEIVIPSDERGPLLIEVPVRLTYIAREGGNFRRTWKFLLRREVPGERWRIIAVELNP
ncbi:hypothetical protein ABEX29_19765 [Brevibacillus porteri]|uniref:hypothetical protein n=1 Tax=Brevibacillus porteri TaxID=2126350 RepID=UPI000381C5FE|nr:hypothetical protein A616_10625 [Brevibacillus brevis X23]